MIPNSNQKRQQRQRQNDAFGPWATALDTGPGAALSTFWRRRMAMLQTVNANEGRTSWRMKAVLWIGGLAMLALPAVYLSRATVVQAEDPPLRQATFDTPEAREDAKNKDVESTNEPAGTPLPPTAPPVAAYQGATFVRASEPSVEFLPEPSQGEQEILAALDRKVALDFVDMPLKDAVAYLDDWLEKKVQIQLDKRPLEDYGVANDTPVSIHVKDVKL